MASASNRIFHLGNRFLVPFLTYIGALAPLSTSMYLPALPRMAVSLNTTDELASYTVTTFALFFGISSLIWGPLSDKYGRKPNLAFCMAIYIVSCIVGAVTNSIWVLMAMRSLQAIGAAGTAAISLAIIKDVLRGPAMERMISFMQAATILAPLCAPVIGGGLLYFTSWRGIFWIQAMLGVLALLSTLALKETCRIRPAMNLRAAFARILVVLSDKKFLWNFILFSALVMPFMSFLAISAFVYQEEFGLSAQEFSLFFAFNALISLPGPVLHIYWLSRYPKSILLSCEIFIKFIGGCLMFTLGHLSPWAFALCMAPVTLAGSASRPPVTVILMNASRGDNGVVASLIQCGAMIFGSTAMYIAPLPFWHGPVNAIALITMIVCGSAFLWWQVLKKNVS